jgi:choline monooxygenase
VSPVRVPTPLPEAPTLGSRELLDWGPEDLAALGVDRLADLYLSEQVLEAEKERVFSGSWFLVATTEELAAPGDYLATSVIGAPVLVVRAGDGQVAAYHNVCRHRGLILADGRGRVGRFLTCPYHQWSYRLDGSLANVPQEEEEFPGLDKSHFGLAPVVLSEWHGMLFVRLSPEGPSLQASWGALGRHLDHFCRGPLVEVARVSYEADCNWKLLVENHVDVYHLWYLHSRSLQSYAHTRFSWQVLGDNWWSHEPLKDPARAPLPPVALAWLDEAERTGIGAHLLFPNLMVVTTGRYLATYDAAPIAPDRTLLTLRIRAAAGTSPGPLIDDVRSFMAEDLEACRRLQGGLGSPAFALGPLARHHEAPVRAFHSTLRRKLVAEPKS